MPQGDRSPIRVNFRRIKPAFLNDRQRLRCEGLVNFKTIDGIEGKPNAIEKFSNRRRWTNAHNFGRDAYSRNGGDTQMAADVMEPDKKYVVYSEGKVQLYQPKIDQVTVYNTGKDKAAVESFLVLGFGGGGHDLLKSFDVKYVGTETVDGVETAKLDLTPKSEKLRNTFARILLWIDPARGISVQQQFFEPSGDYRLAKYSDIQLNQKIPDQAFKLKTTGKTKVVSPQG